MTDLSFDVAVLGAGLAGLTAAVALQRAGFRTVLIERRDEPGGLCGDFEHDGLRFPVASNEFGAGLYRELDALGVHVPRLPTESYVYLGGRRLRLPPDAATVRRLLAASGGLARLALAGRDPSALTLADAVDRARLAPDQADLVGILGYLSGVPIDHLRLADIRDLITGGYNYGLQNFQKPIGGPRVLAESLAERYALLGGRLWLSAEASAERDGERHVVACADGRRAVARALITSEPRQSAWPAQSPEGLRLGKLLLGVDRAFAFPPSIFTVYHVPPDVRSWMADLDRGVEPPTFGFSILKNLIPSEGPLQAMVSWFLLPRGVDDPTPEQASRIVAHILSEGERMLPGLARAVRWSHLQSPGEFTRRHGLSSAPQPRLLSPGARLPDAYDPATDRYHVGWSVRPVGSHGGASVLGGRLVAERVAEKLTSRPRGVVHG